MTEQEAHKTTAEVSASGPRDGSHGSAELDEDAAKLLALGADPGPTWDEVDELDRWVFTEDATNA
jgi:hypothetical protein